MVGIGITFAYILYKFKPAPSLQPTQTAQASNSSPKSLDETKNWKTYKNFQVGYSIDHPTSWNIREFPTHVSFENYENKNYDPDNPVDYVGGSIGLEKPFYLYDTDGNITEEEFVNPSLWFEGINRANPTFAKVSPPESSIIDGKKTMMQKIQSVEGIKDEDVITLHYHIFIGNKDKDILRMSFSYNENSKAKEENIKTFKQIISTFKFLD